MSALKNKGGAGAAEFQWSSRVVCQESASGDECTRAFSTQDFYPLLGGGLREIWGGFFRFSVRHVMFLGIRF